MISSIQDDGTIVAAVQNIGTFFGCSTEEINDFLKRLQGLGLSVYQVNGIIDEIYTLVSKHGW